MVGSFSYSIIYNNIFDVQKYIFFQHRDINPFTVEYVIENTLLNIFSMIFGLMIQLPDTICAGAIMSFHLHNSRLS